MTDILIPLASTILGLALGLLVFWLQTASGRRRGRTDRAHLAECTRQTRLAAVALKNGNEEAYEAHMVLAVEAFDRISDDRKKDGKR